MKRLLALLFLVFGVASCGGGGGGGGGSPVANTPPPANWSSSINGDQIIISFRGNEVAVFIQGNCILILDPPTTKTSPVGPEMMVCGAFWTNGGYHELTQTNAQFMTNTDGTAEIDFQGGNNDLLSVGQIVFSPPLANSLSAEVTVQTSGSPVLDSNHADEAFQPLLIITQNEGQAQFASQDASIDGKRYAFPSSGRVVDPPIQSSKFGVDGGGNGQNVQMQTPTIMADFGSLALGMTGRVTQSTDSNTLNATVWGAVDTVLNQWQYTLTATPPSP